MKRNTPLEILLKIILIALIITVVLWHPLGTVGFWISVGLSVCILIGFFILMYLTEKNNHKLPIRYRIESTLLIVIALVNNIWDQSSTGWLKIIKIILFILIIWLILDLWNQRKDIKKEN